MKSKTYNGEVRSSEKDFETLQLGAFATPGLLLAQGPQVLTAESGFKGSVHRSLGTLRLESERHVQQGSIRSSLFQIVQNVLNGLNGLNVWNLILPRAHPSVYTVSSIFL
jgi:hypothetical protein